MKTYLHAFVMCQSMFCAIPAPQVWDEKAKDKMLLFLPVVGLEIGLLWVGVFHLCRLLEIPDLITAFAMCVFPYLATGCIHLDGYMDVTDAVHSCRTPERRREILKDPHVGSFAVIGIVLLVLAQFALFASAPADRNSLVLAFVPAVSRCGSALAVTTLKPMATSQYADRKRPASYAAVLCAMLVILIAAGIFLCGRQCVVLLGCMTGYGVALWHAYRSLDGMNGDISGYALSIGELCAVAVYALL